MAEQLAPPKKLVYSQNPDEWPTTPPKSEYGNGGKESGCGFFFGMLILAIVIIGVMPVLLVIIGPILTGFALFCIIRAAVHG